MKKIIVTGLVILGLVAVFSPVWAAATPFSIEDIGSSIGLGTADLKETIVNVIQWILGILTLLAVSFVIYGGFVWLTAAGNEERIGTAKKVISAAVIGLIIVMLAWAVVIFVAGTTANVTGLEY